MDETKSKLIILVFCLALAFLVMLLYVFISFSKRRILEKENKLQEIEANKRVELFHATAKAEENQKIKLARNLHDHIIPLLLLRARKISGELMHLEAKGINTAKINEEVTGLLSLSDDIRDVAHGLIPKLFNSWGLIKSLESFVHDMNYSGGPAAEFHNNTIFSGDPPFSKDDQLLIYRMCSEILNNLNKHSDYKYLNVSLEDMTKKLEIVFAHNGKGISNEEIKKLIDAEGGIGLKSLQSKALLLGAEIDYYSDKEVSHVKLIVPVKE